MVNGFDSFREKFKGYEDCYTIIGGTACDILMNEAGLDFRATKDIDAEKDVSNVGHSIKAAVSQENMTRRLCYFRIVIGRYLRYNRRKI